MGLGAEAGGQLDKEKKDKEGQGAATGGSMVRVCGGPIPGRLL